MMLHENNKAADGFTPVAKKSTVNKWQAKLLLLIASLVVISGFAFQHMTTSRAKNDLPQEDTLKSLATLSAPQLAPEDQQFNQIAAQVDTSYSREQNENIEESEAEKLYKMRMVAPTTVYSTSSTSSSTVNQAEQTKNNPGVLGGNGVEDYNTQFMTQVSNSTTPLAKSGRLIHPSTTLAQGTLIWATLETRIVSDLPGMVRAVTSEDIYSEDGSQVLLPKGSRLIGQYNNAIAQGQERVFVVWQRVIRPDHVDIQLNSPGTDALGGAGIGSDSIDHHFFEQFGTATLLSLIGAGAANIGVSSQDQFNSASAYREAIANSFSQTAQSSLKATGEIKPTIYAHQGKVISVFVARDLDFYGNTSLGKRGI